MNRSQPTPGNASASIGDIPSAVQNVIAARLAQLEREEDVYILFAVESGSRAWGFPSPDSDYDVRFVYIRRRADYLRLTPMRDVLEQPIVDEIDLNGWDVRKFLGLLLKSNAVACEWLLSPIRYRPDHAVTSKLTALADAVFDPLAIGRHYASLGQHAAERCLDYDGPVAVKRYFYALRPALAIRAMRVDPWRRPPMNLQQLIGRSQPDPTLVSLIADLVAAKSQTREAAPTCRYPELETFIREEFGRVEELPSRPPPADREDAANALFLRLVDELR